MTLKPDVYRMQRQHLQLLERATDERKDATDNDIDMVVGVYKYNARNV